MKETTDSEDIAYADWQPFARTLHPKPQRSNLLIALAISLIINIAAAMHLIFTRN